LLLLNNYLYVPIVYHPCSKNGSNTGRKRDITKTYKRKKLPCL